MKDLAFFDSKTKKTYEWLKDINEELHWEDRPQSLSGVTWLSACPL